MDFNSISQFVGLIELMKNPEKFDSQVQEAKKAVSDMQELLGAKATVEKADEYSRKVDKDVAAKYAGLEAAEADLQQRKDEFSAYASKKQDEFIATDASLQKREQAVHQAEIDSAKRDKDLDDKTNNIGQREQAANSKVAELTAWETELKEKADKLAAIFK